MRKQTAVLGAALIFVGITGCSIAMMAIQSEPEVLRGRILSVSVGDEFLLAPSDGSRVTARLAGVTAPRGASDIDMASRISLEGLSGGYSVEVKVTGHSYDQVIGEISMGSWNLAETQANRGMVTV